MVPVSETPTPSPRRDGAARGADHHARVSTMFDAVAERYDLMNTVMTWGQEPRLVRHTVARANVPAHGRVLDLATGTGDLAFEVLRQHPDATVVGADISAEMMEVGRRREGGDRVEWVVADAQDLPFLTLFLAEGAQSPGLEKVELAGRFAGRVEVRPAWQGEPARGAAQPLNSEQSLQHGVVLTVDHRAPRGEASATGESFLTASAAPGRGEDWRGPAEHAMPRPCRS